MFNTRKVGIDNVVVAEGTRVVSKPSASMTLAKYSNLEILLGVEEGALELPLVGNHGAVHVEHWQELRELPGLAETIRIYL
jgi:hypothetical protein